MRTQWTRVKQTSNAVPLKEVMLPAQVFPSPPRPKRPNLWSSYGLQRGFPWDLQTLCTRGAKCLCHFRFAALTRESPAGRHLHSSPRISKQWVGWWRHEVLLSFSLSFSLFFLPFPSLFISISIWCCPTPLHLSIPPSSSLCAFFPMHPLLFHLPAFFPFLLRLALIHS